MAAPAVPGGQEAGLSPEGVSFSRGGLA